MPDYGHDIEFGYVLDPDAGAPQGVLETARLADRLGYDLLGVPTLHGGLMAARFRSVVRREQWF